MTQHVPHLGEGAVEMNLIKALACCAIGTAPMVAVGIESPSSMATVVEPPMNNPCANIQWSGRFLDAFPRAPAHCQTVETQDGVKYAKFEGKVVTVDPSHVEVDIVNVADTPDTAIDLNQGSDDAILINNKPGRMADLKTHDTMTFWVQEGMYLISTHPGGPSLPISNVRRINENP
jgi:hypothetical protein